MTIHVSDIMVFKYKVDFPQNMKLAVVICTLFFIVQEQEVGIRMN